MTFPDPADREQLRVWSRQVNENVMAMDSTFPTFDAYSVSATRILHGTAETSLGGSIAGQSSATFTVGVTGAVVGDAVVLGAPLAVEAGLIWAGYTNNTDQVTVRVYNMATASVNIVTGTWKVKVLRG